ncbi:poly-beta-1,6-N-acetyl-D-glucosamine N-deacetylase PgaB [Gammaproteobacteria bacterium 50_400_T64]|nr:poly-beta-1,6-N-acetyl-D-glucosamine N-deacetylase PgaB [Gammaproteobacteria bacterium 50_400_T64]
MAFKPLIFLSLFLVSQLSLAANSYLSLCYHDIRDDVDGIVDKDQMAVSTDNLVAQFEWLKAHNYHAINLDDIIAAENGDKELPENAFLLTFDDGYKSFYTHVLPLLKEYQYPAIVALVGKWSTTAADQQVSYGAKELKPRDFFMSPEEIRTISKLTLVEIASHSFDLHRGVLSNPQGNTQPAAVTFQFDKKRHHYENEVQYRKRIFTDLQQNSQFIKNLTGIKPRAIVWPYGAFSLLTEEIATSLGHKFSLTLNDGRNESPLKGSINRILIQGNPPLTDFVYSLRHVEAAEPVRVAHVDLDYVYDENVSQEDRNLSQLLDRIKAMKINTVFLQAFSDPDGDGNADALYFPNRHLPVRRDLFNRVAWQLKTRSNVNVYAWMPVLSFQIHGTESMRVQRLEKDKLVSNGAGYLRLSPFNNTARKLITDIYEDLAQHTNFAGLLFHDDAYLSDYEDFSPAALRSAASTLGMGDLTIENLRGPLKREWQAIKTHQITQLTIDLAEKVKHYRPTIKTARNIYANVVLNKNSSEWFNQSYPDMLRTYDYTAIMAMPYMEQSKNPRQWLFNLTKNAAIHDPSFDKTLFELQSVDWRTSSPIPNDTLASQFNLLMRLGVKHIGYYPDNFLDQHPSLHTIRSSISLNTSPLAL